MPRKQSRVSRLSERRAARPATIDPNQPYSINESCAILDMSRAGIYKAEKEKKIRIMRGTIDSRPRVIGAELIRIARGEPLAV